MMTTESELSKSIYMSYGGNIQNIGREGMMEDYHATKEEEAEWKRELLDKAVQTILSSPDVSDLQTALTALEYHNYEGLKELLISEIASAPPQTKIKFAESLWKAFSYKKSFDIIISILKENKKEYVQDIFSALGEFINCNAARQFLLESLQSQDPDIFKNAKMTIGIWAYSGMPELRSDGLLEKLHHQQNPLPESSDLLSRIKMILNIKNYL